MHMNWMGNFVEYFLCLMNAQMSRTTMERVIAEVSMMKGIHSGGYPSSRISLNDG